MPSVQIQLANALVEELNGQTFSLEFEAQRTNADWALPLEKAGPLRVDVVAVGKLDTELHPRTSVLYKPAADIILRQKFDGDALEAIPDTNEMTVKEEAIEPLLALVEEINEFLAKRRLAEFPDAAWQSTRLIAPVSLRQLREKKHFTGVLRPLYHTRKALSS